MKTTTLKRKHSKILDANNRHVRLDGQTYLIRSQSFAGVTLADAEPLPQGAVRPIDLFGKTEISKKLRNLVEVGSFS